MSIFGDRVFKDVIKFSLVAQTVKNLPEMQILYRGATWAALKGLMDSREIKVSYYYYYYH